MCVKVGWQCVVRWVAMCGKVGLAMCGKVGGSVLKFGGSMW